MITEANFAAVSAAVDAALRMHPDTPGVGRLCQELLAELFDRPIATPRPARFMFPKPHHHKPQPSRSRHYAELAALTLEVEKLKRAILENNHASN